MPDNEEIVEISGDELIEGPKSDPELLAELKNIKIEMRVTNDRANPRKYSLSGIRDSQEYIGHTIPGYPVKVKVVQSTANKLLRDHPGEDLATILGKLYHLNNSVAEVEII